MVALTIRVGADSLPAYRRVGHAILGEGCAGDSSTYQKTQLSKDGGLAQLGERLAGSQKVTGSSPVSSTYSKPLPNKSFCYLPMVGSAAFPR